MTLKLVFTKGGNLATWRLGVSFSFGVLKSRCPVSVLVWFDRCSKIGSSFGFSFASAQLRFLGFNFSLSFIQESSFILNTNYLNALLTTIFYLLG